MVASKDYRSRHRISECIVARKRLGVGWWVLLLIASKEARLGVASRSASLLVEFRGLGCGWVFKIELGSQVTLRC